MASELVKALRAKYKNPKDALKVLGLDEKLLEGKDEKEDEEEEDKEEEDKAKDEDPREFLKSKLSEDDMKSYDAMCAKSALDEKEDEEEKKAEDSEEDDEKEPPVTKAAMDAALRENTKAIRETERGVRRALEQVEPWVGRLASSLAMDSATDVYRHTAVVLGVPDAKTLHPDALWPVIRAQPKPGDSGTKKQPAFTMDSSAMNDALKYAPGLASITAGA